MGGLSTFGTFTMARLGIFVSQQALNVTGNNITNINTDGYSRQQIDQTSMYYGSADRYISKYELRANGGALATGVNQLRDQYLDIRYRNETTKVGQMETKLSGLDQIAEVFDEVAKGEQGEGVLEARFNDLIQHLENLSQPQNVGTDTADALVRQAAEAMAVQFNDYAKKLETLTETQTAEFKDMIGSVNTALTKIRDLNESIRKSQIFGSEALTQKDERNLLIDEISKKIGIHVTYEMEDLGGLEVEKLVIKTSGDPERTLVDGIYAGRLELLNETNFDLGITQLVDGKGKEDPSIAYRMADGVKQADTAVKLFTPDLEAVQAQARADTVSAADSAAAAAKAAAEDAAKARAENAAGQLNSDASFYKIEGKTYFYQVEEAVTDGQKDYYIRRYETTGDTLAERAEKIVESSGKYVAVSYDDEEKVNGVETVEALADAKKFDSNSKNLANAARAAVLENAEQSAVTRANQEAKSEAYRVAEFLNNDLDSYVDLSDPTKAYFYAVEQLPNDGAAEIYTIKRLQVDYSADLSKRKATAAALDPTDDEDKIEYVTLDPAKRTKIGDTELTGSLQAMRELLTEEGEYADAFDLLKDPDAGTKRGIPYYRQALDTLAREFAKAMNEANTLPDTTIYRMKDDKFVDANGVELADQTDRTKYVLKDEYSYYNGGALFTNAGDSSGTTENITAANISVAYDWSHGSTRVLRSTEKNAPSLKQDNIDHMIALMTSDRDFVFGTASEGTTKFRGTFQDMLTDSIAGTMAKDQNITNSMLNNYTATADELYINRDSVMGVDLNDEAMNMMMFQKAYSAACRLMTTYDGMLDKLINGTAI